MQVAWLNDQQPLLSVFVADGAGSVSQGGEGAMLAVNEAMAYMSQKVQGGELGLNDVLATDIVLTIRQRLFAEAEAKELAVRDFACTFLGLISSPDGTLIMQIGDGGMVVDLGHGLQLPLTPMVGEYANMTHFNYRRRCRFQTGNFHQHWACAQSCSIYGWYPATGVKYAG